MAAHTTIAVNARELRDALDFVSVGEAFDSSAYICRATGKIYWRSAEAGLEDDEFPEDIEDAERYLAVPSQHDLDLGRPLALAFVAAELPADYDLAAGFFYRRGAYRRFKDLLDARGKLEQWYEFENRATNDALRDWCADNGIELVADGPEP